MFCFYSISCVDVCVGVLIFFAVLCKTTEKTHEIQSNEMRFNKQELATLATQPSNKFEKEGILYVTERQDGFFRRSEGKH